MCVCVCVCLLLVIKCNFISVRDIKLTLWTANSEHIMPLILIVD